ncbi:E3 ubiquitin-protein ligase rnf4-like protein [Trifolium pratense]|uniref:E3 ubiquitin-protein ligase rnf4-like protein n=2 Tax=Trifolium TaxID=3898 RepID=A0A2K3NUM4_TRIPR|nr:E3 ubiquitin-protein ligase rnf4-like protein [Trifolium pratense]
MSSRTGRVTAVRGYSRRRKVGLDLDLNLPAGEIPIIENLAGENREQEGPSIQLGLQEVEVHANPQPIVLVEAPMIDVEEIDDDVIESSPRAFAESAIRIIAEEQTRMETVKKPPEPPKEPVFSCPICMGPLVEEMSTRCGHIFCKACIKAAISAQAKCPTCRKKITVKELIRVFLPTTK